MLWSYGNNNMAVMYDIHTVRVISLKLVYIGITSMFDHIMTNNAK